MNTPDLLGGFYPNEQEYFYGYLFGFWLANQWIYALLPHDPYEGKHSCRLLKTDEEDGILFISTDELSFCKKKER